MSEKFNQNTIALVYDFDGTLSPRTMYDYTVLPQLDLEPTKFWREVKRETIKNHADQILTYMRLMVERIEQKKKHFSRSDLAKLAKGIEYFVGVKTWFQRTNKYVKERGRGDVAIKHYLISAGLKEILKGTSIAKHFKQIYASEYFYDHHGAARFPNLVINDTIKTQFLFRINKGREDLLESVNEHMPEEERPIPFSNIIYIGDGLTDVPCMTVTKKNGGFAIAVYRRRNRRAKEVCTRLFQAGRVDFFTIADYRPRRPLERRVRHILDIQIACIQHEKVTFALRRKVEHEAH